MPLDPRLVVGGVRKKHSGKKRSSVQIDRRFDFAAQHIAMRAASQIPRIRQRLNVEVNRCLAPHTK